MPLTCAAATAAAATVDSGGSGGGGDGGGGAFTQRMRGASGVGGEALPFSFSLAACMMTAPSPAERTSIFVVRTPS